jgi:Flp pilus assembly protein CpaB
MTAQERPRPGGAGGWLRLRRAVLRHRPLVTAALAAGAVAAALNVLAPDPPRTVRVLAAAHDLTAGRPLAPGDVATVELPAAAVPDGVFASADSPVGQILAGPVRRGEPLTDRRFVGPSLLAGFGDGLVGVPVRLADPGILAVLRPGDLVDVLAARPAGDSTLADPSTAPDHASPPGLAEVVAPGVRVVAVPAAGADVDDSFSGTSPVAGTDGALVILATTPQAAQRLAAAAVTSSLSAIVRVG